MAIDILEKVAFRLLDNRKLSHKIMAKIRKGEGIFPEYLD